MEKVVKETIQLDASEVVQNFSEATNALEESYDLTRKQGMRISAVLKKNNTFLSAKDIERMKGLRSSVRDLLETVNDDEEPKENQEKNKKLFKELDKVLEKAVESNNKAMALIKEDKSAFSQIEEVTGTAVNKILNTNQGKTFVQIYSEMIRMYLETNDILSTVLITKRPNIYVENCIHLKRLHSMFTQSIGNRVSRTRLCLGCWSFVTIDTSTSSRIKNLIYKNTYYPLLIKFLLFVDTYNWSTLVKRKLHIQDLIYFLYKIGHKFNDKEVQAIFQLEENQESLRFFPFPLIKNPREFSHGTKTGKRI